VRSAVRELEDGNERRNQKSDGDSHFQKVYCRRSQPDSEDPLPGDVLSSFSLTHRPDLDTICTETKQEFID
jgi:hypothetical protein